MNFEWYNKLLIDVDVDLPLNTVGGSLISFSFSISSLQSRREGGKRWKERRQGGDVIRVIEKYEPY